MKRAALVTLASLVLGTIAMTMPASHAAAPVSAERGARAEWAIGDLSVIAEVTQAVTVNPLVDGNHVDSGEAKVTTVLNGTVCEYQAPIGATDLVMDPALNAAQVTFTAASACAPDSPRTFLLVWFGVGSTTASQTWNPATLATGAGLTRAATATLTLEPSAATDMFLEGDLGVTNTASLSESAALAAA